MSLEKDIVVSGLGAVTAFGVDFPPQWDAVKSGTRNAAPTLDNFQAAAHLSDRRMLKAVSKVDALGLVAIESLMRSSGLKPGVADPERVGLYVGAPPASAFDNEFYVDAMLAARSGGTVSATAFGKTCMTSRPTALLVGLPNNVLCYGAMLLDARGPNSNYTASALSGVMATINGARRVKREQLDVAVAGGFSMHSEPVNSRSFAHFGLTPGMTIADGSAFVSLERRGAVAKRGGRALATYLGGAMSSDGLGPRRFDETGQAFERGVRQAMAEAKAAIEQIGLVICGTTGVEALDNGLTAVLARMFGGSLPALATASASLGSLLEASGILEIGLASALREAGEVPTACAVSAEFPRQIDAKRPLTLVVAASAWGEYGAMIVRGEA